MPNDEPSLMRKSHCLAAICGVLILLVLPCAHAASVDLTWEPNAEHDIAGYRLYRGNASRTYDFVRDVGNVLLATADGLEAGKSYWFAITAYNTSKLESDPSNEVLVNVPTGELATAPTGLLAQRAGDRITLEWAANPASEIAFRYHIGWITLGSTNWTSSTSTGLTAQITVPARAYVMVRVAAETPLGVGPYRELMVPGFPKAPTALAVTPDAIRWIIPP